jgi:hypothetical protein
MHKAIKFLRIGHGNHLLAGNLSAGLLFYGSTANFRNLKKIATQNSLKINKIRSVALAPDG